MAPGSLRRRLVLGAMAWLVAALGGGALVLGHAFEGAVDRGFQLRLEAHLRALSAVVDIAADGRVTVGRPAGEPRFEQPYSGWYWQVSDSTAVKARSRSLWDFALPVASGEMGAIHRHREQGPRGEPLDVAERDLRFPEGGQTLHLLVAANRQEVEAEVQHFRLLLGIASAVMAIGLGLAIAIQVGFGLRPLRRLAEELASLRRSGGRIGGTWPDEVTPLVTAMNQVLDHDARMIEAARAHMGNLAHGLKTPLAVLDVENAAPEPDRAMIAQQLARLRHLTEIHLGRARAAAIPAAMGGATASVADTVRDMAAALARIHAARNVAIAVHCDENASFHGTRDDLAELLGNLMDNACKWARTRVVVRTDGGSVVIEDDGPGLSADQIARATLRGIRLDEAAPGSGLGLAIVTDMAGMLGLALDFDRSDLGGLSVRLGLRPDRMAGTDEEAPCPPSA